MKRAYIVLFVVAIVALFANTEVMAIITPPSPQCPQGGDPTIPPTCCEFVDLNNSVVGKALQVYQIGDEWPLPITDGGGNIVKYKWTYQYLGPLGTGGQIPSIAAIAPLCSYPVIVTSVEGGTIIPPGNIFYLSSTPPRTVYFYTDRKKIDNTSLELKIGSSINICRNIEGPVCAPPGISVDLLPCSTIVPMSVPDPENPAVLVNIRITKDCTSRCAVKVEQWINNAWETIDPEVQTEIDGKQLKGCFAPSGDQACQECMIYSTGSPGCYTYSSGGVTYKVPKGCR